MGDVFRFKRGDRVLCGTEEAEVLEVLPRENSYHVRLCITKREMWIAARMVKAAPGKE